MAPPREKMPEGHFSQPKLNPPPTVDPLVEEEIIWQYENQTGCDLRIVQWITITPSDGREDISYGLPIILNDLGSGKLDVADIRAMGFAGGGSIILASMSVYVNGASQPLEILANQNRRINTGQPAPCDCIHIIADYNAGIIRFLPC